MSLLSKIKAQIARWQHGKNIATLKLIAVTGSCGKTTVAHMVGHILRESKAKIGILSTTGLWLDNRLLDQDFCVDAVDAARVYQALSALEKAGAQAAVVETPAQAIRDGAFTGLVFDSTILTNIAGGALAEEFGGPNQYGELVFTPITQTVEEGLVVLNGDDDSVTWLQARAESLPQKVFAAWCRKQEALDWKQSWAGMSFQNLGVFINSPLFTSFNLENLLQAIKVCSKYVGMDNVDLAVKNLHGLPGRMQVIERKGRKVIIDQAYIPSATARVLSDIKGLMHPEQKMIVVLGVPGKHGKSYASLGSIAVEHADIVYIVASDPSSNDVSVLNTYLTDNAEKQRGVVVERIASHEEYEFIDKSNLNLKIERVQQNGDIPMVAFDSSTPSSRYDAIEFALANAHADDLIVILGKGDEDVLDFGHVVYEWKDIDTVNEILQGL